MNSYQTALGSPTKATWPGSGGSPVPENLIGARIVSIGSFVDEDVVSEGGLVISYTPVDRLTICTIVLAFNDSGMWVPASSESPRADL